MRRKAYQKYRDYAEGEPWKLVLCGDGDLRPYIESIIIRLNIGEFVHLPGFLQQKQLLPYFAHARCFVHTSTKEQWGLVINEAMAAGLPVLVSSPCGCVEDLVVEGSTGFSFDPHNEQQLVDLLVKVSSSDFNIKNVGQAALHHIQSFTPKLFGSRMIEAVNHAFSKKS